MQCEYCGRALKPNDWQCPGCGAPIEQHKKEEKYEQEIKNREGQLNTGERTETESSRQYKLFDTRNTGVFLNRSDYGGFFRRLIAELIDVMIIGFGGTILGLYRIDYAIQTIYVIYSILGQSALFKGMTIGKKAMGIRVVGANYEPISFGRAILRVFGKMLSGVSLGIGYIMIIFTKKKQSLHDRICDTYVIRVRK